MNRSKRPKLRLAVRLAPLALAALALAPAAGGELEPHGISPAGASASSPQIASDGHGNIVAVWRELDGDDSAIRAAVKPAGGEWSSSKRISLPAAATESPQVAMDRRGNAVAVWTRSTNGRESVVQAAVLPADGDWSAAEAVSAPGDVAFQPQIAVEAGKATAVWLAMRKRHSVVISSSRTIGGAWAPSETISGPAGNTFAPVVAMDDDGGAVAAWQWFDGVFLVVQAAERSADETWSEPETLPTPGRSTTRPKLVMDGKGNTIVGWIRFNGAWPTAQVVSRGAGGKWREPTNLSNRGGKAVGLELAVSQDGDAVAVWVQRSGKHRDIWSSSRPAGAAHWGARAELGDRWARPDAQIAVDAQGNATAVWSSTGTVSASFKPAGEPWQENYLLSSWDDNSVEPVVTSQSARNATTVWVVLGDEDDRIQSVAYDIDTSAKEHEESEEEEEGEDEDEGDDEGEDEDEGEMLMGTAQADTLVGTRGNDVIYGRGGDDVIDGRGGRDVIYGGAGSDRIVGGKGRDRIFGGAGRDRVAAGGGRDVVFGGAGDDRIAGGDGRDGIFGGTGLDHLAGGRGPDVVLGGDGFDRLAGNRGSDRLIGGGGRDRIAGGRGSDVLVGGTGTDILHGDAGDDTLLAKDRRRDKAFGGSGLDLYRLDRWLDHATSIESRY